MVLVVLYLFRAIVQGSHSNSNPPYCAVAWHWWRRRRCWWWI